MFAMLMGLKSIAPRELHARLKDDTPLVVDLNAPHSWLKARVPGALNLMPDFDAGALPAERSTPLVFYCSNPLCRKAPNAARRAEKLGTATCVTCPRGFPAGSAPGCRPRAAPESGCCFDILRPMV